MSVTPDISATTTTASPRGAMGVARASGFPASWESPAPGHIVITLRLGELPDHLSSDVSQLRILQKSLAGLGVALLVKNDEEMPIRQPARAAVAGRRAPPSHRATPAASGAFSARSLRLTVHESLPRPHNVIHDRATELGNLALSQSRDPTAQLHATVLPALTDHAQLRQRLGGYEPEELPRPLKDLSGLRNKGSLSARPAQQPSVLPGGRIVLRGRPDYQIPYPPALVPPSGGGGSTLASPRRRRTMVSEAPDRDLSLYAAYNTREDPLVQGLAPLLLRPGPPRPESRVC